MSTVTELVERNKAFAKTHQPIPTLAELGAMGAPSPHIIVFTCMDPRCRPEDFLNLKVEDGVIVSRNVCGHIGEDAINNVVALDSFIGITDIVIIHHTDCGTTHIKEATVREDLKKRLPDHPEIDNMSFGAISDLAQSVKDDIKILKSSPYIRKELADRCYGFVYDLKTGLLTPVEV